MILWTSRNGVHLQINGVLRNLTIFNTIGYMLLTRMEVLVRLLCCYTIYNLFQCLIWSNLFFIAFLRLKQIIVTFRNISSADVENFIFVVAVKFMWIVFPIFINVFSSFFLHQKHRTHGWIVVGSVVFTNASGSYKTGSWSQYPQCSNDISGWGRPSLEVFCLDSASK